MVTLAAGPLGVASGHDARLARFALSEVPTVTMQPEDQTVTAGEHAIFEAGAEGYTAVQWEVSVDRGATFVPDTIDPGNNTTTLRVEKVPATDNGWKYRAVFTNEAGAATSQAARLVVNVAPVVISQPIGQTVSPGQAATFQAVASARPTPTVHWQVSVNGGITFANDRTDAGNTTGTLTVTPASFAQNGYEYRAVFNNAAGAATSAAATLTVMVPPVASFAWFPPFPHTGEPVSLASNSSDVASPIIGFGWDLIGSGPFIIGTSVLTTSFATPGEHLVRLRVTDANGLSSIAAQAIPVTSPPPTVMRPFPLVRIEGSNAGNGTRLALLLVLAPVGSHVTVTCHGHGCPTRRATRVARAQKGKRRSRAVAVTFAVYEHVLLKPGVVLEIRVGGLGEIGKYTKFVIRRGRFPARADACLAPGSSKPVSC